MFAFIFSIQGGFDMNAFVNLYYLNFMFVSLMLIFFILIHIED